MLNPNLVEVDIITIVPIYIHIVQVDEVHRNRKLGLPIKKFNQRNNNL